jgi:hypothetical protein
MPRACNYSDCNAAVTLIDDNGITDPSMDRIETYECERGHQFRVTLKGEL